MPQFADAQLGYTSKGRASQLSTFRRIEKTTCDKIAFSVGERRQTLAVRSQLSLMPGV
jgi:hypothetical protein